MPPRIQGDCTQSSTTHGDPTQRRIPPTARPAKSLPTLEIGRGRSPTGPATRSRLSKRRAPGRLKRAVHPLLAHLRPSTPASRPVQPPSQPHGAHRDRHLPHPADLLARRPLATTLNAGGPAFNRYAARWPRSARREQAADLIQRVGRRASPGQQAADGHRKPGILTTHHQARGDLARQTRIPRQSRRPWRRHARLLRGKSGQLQHRNSQPPSTAFRAHL
jgi:hypothetical protein